MTLSRVTRRDPRIWLSLAALVVALAVFLALSLRDLALPGLYYDEALDLTPMLDLLRGADTPLLRNIGVGKFPVMLLDYMGSLNGYLTLPFTLLFGSGVVAARAEPLFFSCATIVLAWVLARRWFGDGVAAVAALLLAVNPSFVWFSRQGISVTSVMTVFAVGSVLALDVWRGRAGALERSNVQTLERLNLPTFQPSNFPTSPQPPNLPTSPQPPNPQTSRPATHRPANVWLILAGLALGLGLWAKFLFFRWWLAFVAMELVWLGLSLLRARPVTQSPSHAVTQSPSHPVTQSPSPPVSPAPPLPIATWLRPRALVWLALGVLVGAAPLIFYNLVGLVRDGTPYTVGLLLSSLAGPTQQFGVNNADLASNLNKALDDVRVFVDGSYFWYNGVPFSNVYAVPALLLAIVVGCAFALAPRPAAGRRPPNALQAAHFFQALAALFVLTFMGAFTVSGLWATHQFIMAPWLQFVVACGAVWLAKWLADKVTRGQGDPPAASPKRPLTVSPFHLVSAAIVVALLALPFSRDLWVNEQHHAKLEETGGSGRFSDAVYKIAAYFDQRRVAAPVALDWGIEKQIRVLTADRVRPVEIFGFTPEPSDEFIRRAREYLRDPNQEYVVLWDRFAVYNRRTAFTALAESMGKKVTETFIAHEKSGLPVYVVLKAQ